MAHASPPTVAARPSSALEVARTELDNLVRTIAVLNSSLEQRAASVEVLLGCQKPPAPSTPNGCLAQAAAPSEPDIRTLLSNLRREVDRMEMIQSRLSDSLPA
jgi:hypothetical protein